MLQGATGGKGATLGQQAARNNMGNFYYMKKPVTKASRALGVLSPTCRTATQRCALCKLQRIQIHQWREKLAYELQLNGLFAHNINIYLLQPQLKSAGRKRWHNLNSLPLTQKHCPSLFSLISWCTEGARTQTLSSGQRGDPRDAVLWEPLFTP